MGTIDIQKYQNLIHDPKALADLLQHDFGMHDSVDPFLVAKKLGIDSYPMPLAKDLFSYSAIRGERKIICFNGQSQIQRQRYNVAFQTYLLLAGKSDYAYYKNHKKTDLINNAKTFAANFLLPKEALREEIQQHLNADGKIEFDDILLIADKFGVSFKTTAFRIFYEYNNIEGIKTREDLDQRLGDHVTFREVRQKMVPDYKKSDLKFIKQLLNSCDMIESSTSDVGYIKTIQDAIYGEIKFEERSQLTRDEIIEIYAEYRLNGRVPTGGCLDENLVELVCGQLNAYDFIKSKQMIRAKDLPKLIHSLLFKEVDGLYNYGEFRTEDVYVQGLFRACKPTRIESKMNEVYGMIDDMYATIDGVHAGTVSKSDAIDQAVRTVVTHYMTQPFQDGNGRTSKAMLNYFLTLMEIPGSFVVADDIMDEYRQAIGEVGKFQKIREDQLAGDYVMRIIDRETGKEGTFDYNAFGIPMVKFEDGEVVYEEELHKMEFCMPVEGKVREYTWEDLQEIDYTPLELVIYKSIVATYLEGRVKPKLRIATPIPPLDIGKIKKSSIQALGKITLAPGKYTIKKK